MLNLNLRKNRWILFRDSTQYDREILAIRLVELGPHKSWCLIEYRTSTNDSGTLTIPAGQTRGFDIFQKSDTQIGVGGFITIRFKFIHGLPNGSRARFGIIAPKEIRITQLDRELKDAQRKSGVLQTAVVSRTSNNGGEDSCRVPGQNC